MALTEEEKREYPELVGSEIIWDMHEGNFVHVGIVVGCDYHVGITIVDAEDKDDYLTCIHGPLSKIGKQIAIDKPDYEERYNYIFERALRLIQNGYYITNPSSGFGPSASTCPFGQ